MTDKAKEVQFAFFSQNWKESSADRTEQPLANPVKRQNCFLVTYTIMTSASSQPELRVQPNSFFA